MDGFTKRRVAALRWLVALAGLLTFGTAMAAEPTLTAPALSPKSLVAAVLERNPGIAAMQAAADAADARIEQAGALDDPMLSYTMAPGTFGAHGQSPGQSVEISQSFPWPGTLDLRADAAKAVAKSAQQRVAELQLQLAARTRAAYAKWYYVFRALSINANNQGLVKRLGKVAETAYSSGAASQQDVLQAEVELTRLENQAFELHSRRRSVQAEINALLNRPPRASLPPPADLPPPRFLPAYAALQATALDRYPALKSLDALVVASQDRVKLAEKDRYPSFKAMVGYNSMWDQPAMRPMIGVGINIPFGGNHRGAIDEAHAALRQSRAERTAKRAQLLSELEQAYAATDQAAATIRLYQDKLLPLAGQNLAAAESDYRSGRGDFLNLITAERQLLMAKLELARARAERFTQLAALDYRSGGALFTRASSTPYQDTTP